MECTLQGRHCSSKTEPVAHLLVVKWNKFQKEYENRIKHFLPRVGDHPDVTVQGVVTEWDPKSKAVDQGKDTQIPVDFPPETVTAYKSFNDEYVPQSPIKQLDAELLLDILPLMSVIISDVGMNGMPQKRRRRTLLHPAAFQERHHRLRQRLRQRIRKTPTNHDPHHLLSIQTTL